MACSGNSPPLPPYTPHYTAKFSDEHSPLLESGALSNRHSHGVAISITTRKGSGNPLRSLAWHIIMALITTHILSVFLGAFLNESLEPYERTRLRKEWDVERKKHSVEIEQYKREEQRWCSKIDAFEEEWKKMVDREMRERERARLYWDDVRRDEHCLSNGHRKYSARLANLIPSIDGMEACKATPITLNGVTYDKPISCEDMGHNSIRGHWIASDETVCAAYWEFVKSKGCTAQRSGLLVSMLNLDQIPYGLTACVQRVEAKLGVIHDGEDREKLCLTTPLTFNGRTYEHPMACPNWVSNITYFRIDMAEATFSG
ncbi:hypothetical protein H0H92_003257 [Tricholoma furcatifolium]|nr:hypothetical protein H0H92_003257 [Tricholoma furcatifolium]